MTISSAEDLARRVAVFHTITREVDRHTLAIDPADLSRSDIQRASEIHSSASRLLDVVLDRSVVPEDELRWLGALVVGWLEDRARDQATRNQATKETP